MAIWGDWGDGLVLGATPHSLGRFAPTGAQRTRWSKIKPCFQHAKYALSPLSSIWPQMAILKKTQEAAN